MEAEKARTCSGWWMVDDMQAPERLHVIDSTLSIDAIRLDLERQLAELVQAWQASDAIGSLA